MEWVIGIVCLFVFFSYAAYCSCADKAENENYLKAKAEWEAKNPGKKAYGWGWQNRSWKDYPYPPETRLEKAFNWIVDCLIPQINMPPPNYQSPEQTQLDRERKLRDDREAEAWKKALKEWENLNESKIQEVPRSVGEGTKETA